MDEITIVDEVMLKAECNFTDANKRKIFEQWQKDEADNPQPFALIRLLRLLYSK